jgi:trk system potassium uptake protein TrkH
MNWKLILKLVSSLNVVVGATMIVPVLIAVIAGTDDWLAFLAAFGVTLLVNGVLYMVTRKADSEMTHRDAFIVVSLAWATVCLFGALPFWFSGEFGGFTNAVFESVSGFTTTGSTILPDVAAMHKATLFWRSIIQWYGGMGIIVLSLAVLPVLGIGGMQIFKAEVPGPTADKLQPRMRDTAMLLWKVYVLITAVEALLLWVGGMTLFDAVCHSFTTLATGGFGTKSDSFMSMNPFLQLVATVFMVLAGVNFALHYLMLRGRFKQVLADGELRVYLSIFLISTLALTLLLRLSGLYESIWQAFRHGVFQVASILTTTGYNSADFEAWGKAAPLAPVLLFLLMFVGGMAGSTGGGMKVVRVWLVLKHGYRELFRLIHPHAVRHVKVGGKVVGEHVLDAVIGFVGLYLALFLVATLTLAMFGHDFVTSFSAVAACIGNIGPGLGTVGPLDNFAHLQTPVKWVLSACMLLGRLEIYTILLLIVPEFWRK